MASLTQIIQFTTTVIGEAVRHIGEKNTPTTLTINGQVWDSGNFTVADNFGTAIPWTSGGGGMNSFSYLIFLANADMWLEFANTTPNPDERALVFVPANAILVIPSAFMGGYANNTSRFNGANLVLNTAYGLISEIRCQRNVAAGNGAATCRMVLIN